MSLDIEELSSEPLALKRSSTNKIVGRESYKGVSPGTLKLRVYYRAGCLNVHLGKARLNGRRSQDPYALVYLLDSFSGSCYFQKNNRQTDVFDKTTEPNFNKTFYFKMDLSVIKQKCLVVAVWDKDTRSHDDFMAGISIGLQQVQSFDDSEVQVNLNHQDANGHPVPLDGNVEEKFEERARYRADRNKILGPEKYDSHGSLTFKINYFWGFLHVHLDSAELYGKRSQDPYALVYLLGGNGLAKFQIDNNCTKTYDKNIKPEMKHDFFFKIRFSLRDLVYFQKLDKIVKVDLRHQHRDGHPALISDREINSYFQVYAQDSSRMDLKSCNNKLVSFIEKARVLAEALDVKASLPDQLQEKTTVEVQVEDMQNMIRQEVEALTERMRERRRTLQSRVSIRSELERENEALRDQVERNLHTLRSEENLLYNMEVRLTELSSNSFNLGHLRDQIQAVEERIRQSRSSQSKVSWRDYQEDLRKSESHFRESEKKRASLNALNLGLSRRVKEKSEIYLRIKTEYEAKIKNTLTEQRLFLRKNYEDFIRTLEGQAEEIMLLYEEIVKAKFDCGPGMVLELEKLERGRKYSERIQSLQASITDLQARVDHNYRMLDALAGKYNPQMSEVEVGLRKYKEDLARVLQEMSEAAMTRYDLASELGIYGQLLASEETRITSHTSQHRVTVRDSTSRRSHRASALAMNLENSSSSHTRRESGYFSPDSRSRSRTPDNFLEGGEASAMSRGGEYDRLESRHFHQIRDDVFSD